MTKTPMMLTVLMSDWYNLHTHTISDLVIDIDFANAVTGAAIQNIGLLHQPWYAICDMIIKFQCVGCLPWLLPETAASRSKLPIPRILLCMRKLAGLPYEELLDKQLVILLSESKISAWFKDTRSRGHLIDQL